MPEEETVVVEPADSKLELSPPEVCISCRRPFWARGSSVLNSDTECVVLGDLACRLTSNINSIAAAMRSLAKSPKDQQVRMTSLAVLEHIAGVVPHCPKCGATQTVRDGVNNVHFPTLTDQRPCLASGCRVIGGVLL